MKNTFSQLITCSFITLSLFSNEDNWCLNDGFAVWGDAALFRRNMGNKHHLIIDKAGGRCKSSRLVQEFNYQPGFQVGMVYMTYHTLLEAKYLWIREWEASCSRHDAGLLFFSEDHLTFAQDFFNADKASAEYKSQFQNGEVNYFYYITPRRGDYFSGGWLAGVRYIHLTENLEMEFHKGSHQSPYRIHVWNDIPALQAGATLGWNPTRMLSWDLTAKLGMGFDCSRQHTFWGDVNNTVVLEDYKKTGFSTPLLLEASISLTYQPWRFLNLHASYEGIYLNGIALAPDQINTSPKLHHHIRTYDQALYHGATLGLTFLSNLNFGFKSFKDSNFFGAFYIFLLENRHSDYSLRKKIKKPLENLAVLEGFKSKVFLGKKKAGDDSSHKAALLRLLPSGPDLVRTASPHEVPSKRYILLQNGVKD